MNTAQPEYKHLGRKVKRLRESIGIKQSALAADLGTTQQNISKIEQDEDIDEPMLEKIAAALGVTTEVIRNFNDETAAFHIQSMYDSSQAIYQYHFNPIDKIVELYDALLKSEKEKNELLEKLLNEKGINMKS